MTGYIPDLSWKSGARAIEKLDRKVDAGDFKHELLNRLRSTMAVNVLRWSIKLRLKVFVRFDEMESVLCDWLGVVGREQYYKTFYKCAGSNLT